MKFSLISIIAILLLGSSCAGPMGPFGASSIPPLKASVALLNEAAPALRLPAMNANQDLSSISFYPNYQNFHSSSDLKIIIEDPSGVKLNGDMRFLYGDDDVTSLWNRYAKKEFKNNGKTLELTMAKIRFLAGTDRRFVVAYRSSKQSDYTVAALQRPICPMYELASIRNPMAYGKGKALVATIERESISEGINPNLMAGLVAQESGYNPRAVSIAKAIGLTQVTGAAGEHVFSMIEGAKSYEGIEKMGYPELMLKVYSGEINRDNEWRLNPKHSILGGLYYINFLRQYWQSEDSKRQLSNVFNGQIPWEDIILASYNSGPYRVKTAMQSHAQNWIYHPRLGEARKYITKVRSYCHSFAQNTEVIK